MDGTVQTKLVESGGYIEHYINLFRGTEKIEFYKSFIFSKCDFVLARFYDPTGQYEMTALEKML